MSNSVQTSVAAIIPTYNRENTIIKCVESVLAQTLSVDEIFIIDDCSTDHTIDRLRSFRKKISILQTDKQSGAQKARNVGIRAAKSNWIAFLDSDDEWLPNKIEKQFSALKTVNFNPNTVIHGDSFRIKSNSTKKKYWQPIIIDGNNSYRQLLTNSGTLFPSLLTSKSALKNIGYLDEKIEAYQEWDTAIRLAKFCRFIHIQEPLFIYRTHEQTISKDSDKSIDGYQYVVNKHKQEIIYNCGVNVFNSHLYINAKLAMNSNQFDYAINILNSITPKNVKVKILLFLCKLRIKPLHFTKMRRFYHE